MTTPQDDGPVGTQTVDEAVAEMFPDTGQEEEGTVVTGDPEPAPTSEAPVTEAPPTTQEPPAAETPPAPVTEAPAPTITPPPSQGPSETDRLRQEIAARDEQLRLVQERHDAAQIEDRVRQYEQSLVQQNWAPEQAQHMASRERQYLELVQNQKRESDAAMANYRLRVDTAMRVSKQHGVDYDEVVKFDSQEQMEAYARQGAGMTKMQQQIADLQKQAGPAPQIVDRGPSTPSGTTSRNARMQALMDKADLSDAEMRELGELTGS